MSYPIAELITQNVIDTLSVFVDSNGDTYTVETANQDGSNSPADRKLIVYAADPVPQEHAPLGLDEYVLPVKIGFWAIKDETAEPDLRPWLYTYAADIHKALGADLHRGGRAVNTTFEKDQFFFSESPMAGLVTASIRFRTLLNNPYER